MCGLLDPRLVILAVEAALAEPHGQALTGPVYLNEPAQLILTNAEHHKGIRPQPLASSQPGELSPTPRLGLRLQHIEPPVASRHAQVYDDLRRGQCVIDKAPGWFMRAPPWPMRLQHSLPDCPQRQHQSGRSGPDAPIRRSKATSNRSRQRRLSTRWRARIAAAPFSCSASGKWMA